MPEKAKSILFVGHAFYNAWYLSRELRKLGWKADVINIDNNPETQGFYHGQDIQFQYNLEDHLFRLNTYLTALRQYEVFHFSNQNGIYFINDQKGIGRLRLFFPILEKLISVFFKSKNLDQKISLLISFKLVKSDASDNLSLTRMGYWFYRRILGQWFSHQYGKFWDIHLLKLAGKKIGYTNNGCLDGVLKSTFSQWKPFNTCSICKWNNHPEVCSDELNRKWGEFRNSIADYQCNIGSNKADYNLDDSVFESPWFYCLDTNFWNPETLIPSNYLLPFQFDIVKIYHSVGNFEKRSDAQNVTIKCTHIYLDLIDKFKKEGLPVELVFFHGLPNKIIRYYQMQSDIVVDMLTFGFFGANVREAMMLGKPVVCYLRPEWLEDMRREIPDYVAELPIVSATPDTVEEILRELIDNKQKREEIGRKSRKFAVKWHGSDKAAQYFDQFLSLQIEGKADKKTVFDIQKRIYN